MGDLSVYTEKEGSIEDSGGFLSCPVFSACDCAIRRMRVVMLVCAQGMDSRHNLYQGQYR